MHAQPELDVAGDVAMRKERVLLEHEPEAPFVRRDAGHVVAVPGHGAAVQGLQPRDRTQQRRLATPTRSEHRERLTVGHRQADIVDDDPLAETHNRVFDFEHSELPQVAHTYVFDREHDDPGEHHQDRRERERLADVE